MFTGKQLFYGSETRHNWFNSNFYNFESNATTLNCTICFITNYQFRTQSAHFQIFCIRIFFIFSELPPDNWKRHQGTKTKPNLGRCSLTFLNCQSFYYFLRPKLFLWWFMMKMSYFQIKHWFVCEKSDKKAWAEWKIFFRQKKKFRKFTENCL